VRLPHALDVLGPTVTTDRRGNPVESWSPPTTVAAGVQAFVQPASSTETFHTDGTRMVTGLVAYVVRPGVLASQRVLWRGEVYLIDGAPDDFETPAGYHHSVLRLRQVEG
jgi:hypothetical protein